MRNIEERMYSASRIKRLLQLSYVIIVVSLLLFFSSYSNVTAIDIESRVIKRTLSNGMTVLMMQRPQVPICSLYIRFKTGKVDEMSGQTGTAHLLEHLLFKGTRTLGTRNYEKESLILNDIKAVGKALDAERLKARNGEGNPNRIEELSLDLAKLQELHKGYVIKDEINQLYSQNGAAGLNAYTSADVTTYLVSLPSNRIELWARIESDRMLNPVFREFYSERDVVLEERRQSNESNPFRKLLEQFLASAFIAHPYRNPIIGWESDLELLDPDEIMAFFRKNYAPNNVVISAVGDVDTDTFMGLIEAYFGRIPAQPPVEPIPTSEPPQDGERRIKVLFDAEPQIIIGYLKPTIPHRADYVFDVISAILSDGRTSRLYKRLVVDEMAAVKVSAINGMPGARYDNIFMITAVPRYPNSTEEIERMIYEEIERLKNKPVSDWEMGKIKNQIQADFIRDIASNSGMAEKLSYYETVTGDWRYINTFIEVISTITPEEIQAVAKEYLGEERRTVTTLVKSGGE